MKRINEIKVVLAKLYKTGKLLVETLRKNEIIVSYWYTNKPQLSVKKLTKTTSALKENVKAISVSIIK
jgi:hypothetical protein